MSIPRKLATVPDRRGRDGHWLQCWTEGRNPATQYRSRASRVWGNITSRCKPGGACQARSSAYQGCVNGFEGFQQFAEWAQEQFGYTSIDRSGSHWALDKDILAPGGKIYSPDTCIFVPARINMLLVGPAHSPGGLPMGASFYKDRYRATVKYNGHAFHLGFFTDPLEASHAWRMAKADIIDQAILEPDLQGHSRLTEALAQIAESLRRTPPKERTHVHRISNSPANQPAVPGMAAQAERREVPEGREQRSRESDAVA